MPVKNTLEFNKSIIHATHDLVCAYKPNLAFYEALGLPGLRALEGTIDYIRSVNPHLIIIADAKRGDIGNTASAYARALFDVWDVDAATVNPYLGTDSLEPFLSRPDRGVFILCRTSNTGSSEMQMLSVSHKGYQQPLYKWVALKAMEWNRLGNVGLVAGATHPTELEELRKLCPDMPFLVPGIGTQGGDLEASVRLGMNSKGRRSIINSSRGIIYASHSRDYTQAARDAAMQLRDNITRTLGHMGKGW